jgi:cytidine deaminase
VSFNPFRADPGIRSRQERLAQSIGIPLRAEILSLLPASARRPGGNDGAVLPKEKADALIAKYALTGIEELMLLALVPARTFAKPPISSFFVGAVGLERETGGLVFGGNMEFPQTHLGFTVHGEGFVLTRAAARGTTISHLAIGEAHPCAHCRQYLSEFAASRDLILIDPLGHRLSMAELYPWPFDPDYLGEAGYVPGVVHEDRELAPNELPPAIATALLEAVRRAHAPYSKCPGAVVLVLKDGGMISGFAIESVAFNPTMGPLQAALINLGANGYEPADIAAAALATCRDGAVDYSLSTAELLGKVAPAVPLTLVGVRNEVTKPLY